VRPAVLPLWLLATAVLPIVAVVGCKKDDMAEQPKLNAYQPTDVFADGTEARPLVAGTVARNPKDVPGIPYTMAWVPGPVGASDKPLSQTIPMPITPDLIERGQGRFNIYCAVCHGRLGDANGMIVQRGMIKPPSFHNDRLNDPVKTPDSHFYDVISNGYGAMFSYAERVRPDDRWAITAYIRTLQESVKEAAKDGRLSQEQYTALKGARP
jgi:mono/diheme cytochrome c family protein